MALEFDIKANDEFSASIDAAASGLLQVAKHEDKVNDITRQLGKAYKEAAGYAQNMSQRTREAVGAASLLYGQSEKIAQVGKTDRSKMLAAVNKEYATQKKENVERKKWLDIVKTGAKGVAEMSLALVASAAAAAALAYKLLDAGKGAHEARREAGALLDAWTGQRGPKALALIDGMAQKIGLSFDEARSKFLAFREAGLNNKLSFKLLKIRQDLIAMGLSAEAADKEVARVTSVGHDPYARIRAIKELERSFKGVGTGAMAAYHALHSVDGAQTRIGNAANTVLVDLWKNVGPEIGEASNRMADFLIDLMQSERGQAAISSLAESVKDVARAFNSANFERALTVIETGANIARGLFKMLTFDVDSAGKAFENALRPLADWIDNSIPKWKAFGQRIVDGIVSGITSKISEAADVAKNLAKSIADPFAKALGIQSPSKLFAEYGRQTVAGYERGQVQALGDGTMPIQGAATQAPAAAPGTAVGGGTITIENLIVQGGTNASADDISRSVRRELQLLINAGALSRGFA